MTYNRELFCESLAGIEQILGPVAAAAATLNRSLRSQGDDEPLTPAQIEAATALVAAIDRALDSLPEKALDDFACVTEVLAGRAVVDDAGDLVDVAKLEERLGRVC